MCSGSHFRARGLLKIMIQGQDCVLYPSQLMFGTKGHDLTIVLSASALLCPLLAAFITISFSQNNLFLHSPFLFLLPSWYVPATLHVRELNGEAEVRD